ncbi:MAG: DUF938 domain-containing protein [Kiloniellales bacterium]
MDQKLSSPAAERNQQPLIDALAPRLPRAGMVLELASGPGQHATAFARHFQQLSWQPSDADPRALASIAAWRAESGLENLLAPIALDVMEENWWQAVPEQPAAAFSANMTHIAPWAASEGLIAGLAALLPSAAPVVVYGPYLQASVETAPSNLSFDASLRARNPQWGIRSAEDMDALAERHGFAAETRIAMPANNTILTYRKG